MIRNPKNVINQATASLAIFLLLASPIIYRILKIQTSGLNNPGGQGNIQAHGIGRLFENMNWMSNASIPFTVPIIIVVTFVIIFFKHRKINKISSERLIPLFVLILLIIYATNIFPWNLFNRVPILNTIHGTDWRFAQYFLFPTVLILISFQKHFSKGLFLGVTLLIFFGTTISVFRTQ
jgi:hypothetical protein